MKKIGITGGIATGKSTLLYIIKKLGFPVFSCDEAVKNLYKNPKIKQQLLNIFGKNILNPDNSINKKIILELILKDPRLKEKLENLLHPAIKTELLKFFKSAETKHHKIAFAEVPLLFEAKWESLFDEIWVITCSKNTQKQRIKSKTSYADLFIKLSKKQIPLKTKEKKAHKVFSSEKSIDALENELKTILKAYLKD